MLHIFSNSLGKEELAAVERVFKSRWLGLGIETQMFQRELGAKIGTEKVLCVNSATAAAFMSMKILDIEPGDEVIIPTVNFIGCSNAIIEAGARPVFADVDLKYLNIIPSEIERLRTNKTKAVLLLHYGGHPADMNTIKKYSEGLKIIEDSACAPFSTYKGKNCGTLGDIGFYSFDAMKILSTGDGGAIVLKTNDLFERAKEIRYLGIANRQSGIDAIKAGISRWWEIELNATSNRFIPNDISSAIGRVQLKKVDSFLSRRKQIWEYYQNELSSLKEIECPPESLPDTASCFYLYWITIQEKRDALAAYLNDNGVYCTFRYFPLHLIKHYQCSTELPNSEKINDTVLNIPIHQNLTDNDLKMIVKLIKKFFKR